MRGLIAAAGALLIVVPSGNVPIGAAAEVRPDALEQAREFRLTVGFDTTSATLTRAATDPIGFPDSSWGVPLSRAEALELQRALL